MREYDIDLMGLMMTCIMRMLSRIMVRGKDVLHFFTKWDAYHTKENYLMMVLRAETYERDARTVENELLKIRQLSNQGANICVPLAPLTKELDAIQRLSPKLAGYLKQRLNSINLIV